MKFKDRMKLDDVYKNKSDDILEDIKTKNRNVADLIVEMKNLVNLAIELGFSALILQDKKLIEKIYNIEEEIDVKQYEIETECMLATKTPEEALGLTSVIRLASALEDISNAIKEFTDALVRGIKPHPIILQGLRRSLDIVDYVEIGRRSKALGKTMTEVTEDTAEVIGLKRDGHWTYLPKHTVTIQKGDVIIIAGRKDSITEIRKRL